MIYCANCGTTLQSEDVFCPTCGIKNEITNKTSDKQPLENTVSSVPSEVDMPSLASNTSARNQSRRDISNFLHVSLPDLTKKVLFDPLDGTKKILTEIKEPAKIGFYCILVSALVITFLIYLRIPSEVRREVRLDFFEYFFRAFFLPVLGAFIIAFFSFIVKAINNSQKSNFGNEVLTGGIVSIGYAVFFILIFILSFIMEDILLGRKMDYEFGVIRKGPSAFTYIILFSVFIYLFTITSNSLSQSLRSSGVKDATAFYLSPFIVIFSAYLTIKLWIALFAEKYGFGLNDLL